MKRALVSIVLLHVPALWAGEPTATQFDCLESLCAPASGERAVERRAETCLVDREKKLLITSTGAAGSDFYVSNTQGVWFFSAPLDDKIGLDIRFPNRQSLQVTRRGISSHQFVDFYLERGLSDTRRGSKREINLKPRNLVSERKTMREDANLVAWIQIHELFRRFMGDVDFKGPELTLAEFNEYKSRYIARARGCTGVAETDRRIAEAIHTLEQKLGAFVYTQPPLRVTEPPPEDGNTKPAG